nr:uncharacterized protein LOC110081425 [Pogona vitticeps]
MRVLHRWTLCKSGEPGRKGKAATCLDAARTGAPGISQAFWTPCCWGVSWSQPGRSRSPSDWPAGGLCGSVRLLPFPAIDQVSDPTCHPACSARPAAAAAAGEPRRDFGPCLLSRSPSHPRDLLLIQARRSVCCPRAPSLLRPGSPARCPTRAQLFCPWKGVPGCRAKEVAPNLNTAQRARTPFPPGSPEVLALGWHWWRKTTGARWGGRRSFRHCRLGRKMSLKEERQGPLPSDGGEAFLNAKPEPAL